MNPSETLRLFLAIPLPDDARTELRRLQSKLQSILPSRAVRWTRPEQFHLTLKFLGDVPATATDELIRSARTVCEAALPMRLRAEGTGFFPDIRSPRVFWVNIKSLDGRLLEFQRQLDLAVQPFAKKEDAKKFTAHVTLARLEKMRSRETEKLIAAFAAGKIFGEWTVTEAHLIKSLLQPSGALHIIVDTFKTKNPLGCETFL
ncbi:MAG TPA: RNA 2',3'-cyclic phosphodiesterase [Verrucomicrobiae bacterium]|jgi:2'-5' RNA ligase|nr:RNA 2',3'-cyclic phosphodiesterase [Verrucomicrobiae bacterium]